MIPGAAYMLADAILSAVAAKLERDVILARVREKESQGASPEQITEEIHKMREEAIAAAQEEIDKAARG